MLTRRIHAAATLTLAATLGLVAAAAPGAEPDPPPEAFVTAEGLVAALYEEVTFPAGGAPDWDRVRSMFLDRATVVLRTGREETTVFTVGGFVQDFVDFIERANVRETGFRETILETEPLIFGDIAHLLVLYEAHIPGSDRPPLQGVDSFQLIRKEGRWWIVSVINELPTAERPVPRVLQRPRPAGR